MIENKESTKLEIGIDKSMTLVVELPKKMTAMEYAGFAQRMSVIKAIAKTDVMNAPTTRKLHTWTQQERDFIKKNPKMGVKEVKKALKLEHMSDGAVYATMKTVRG